MAWRGARWRETTGRDVYESGFVNVRLLYIGSGAVLQPDFSKLNADLARRLRGADE